MWKSKNVWIVLSGELIAGLGLWMGIIGNLEFMQMYVPSDFMKSFILFLGLLAGVLTGPIAGNIIDQFPKKLVLIVASFGRMISVLFMFWAIYEENILYMILFLVLIQLSSAFYFPTLQSIIPSIVQDQELIKMNSVHMNIATIARVAGTALAGGLLAVVSLNYLYIGSMIAYGVLLVATFMLRLDEQEEMNENRKMKRKVKFLEVWPILKDSRAAYEALLLTIVPMLFIGGFNLMVIEISEWQQDSTIKGLLYTAEGLSFLIGATIVKKISDKIASDKLLFHLAFIVMIAHLSLFFSFSKPMSIVSFSLFGFAVGCFFPVVSTIFQTKIDKEYHGRLFSFRNMFDRILFQIVLLTTGLCLDTIGFQVMVLIFGLMSLSIILLLKSKSKVKMSQSSSI